MEKLDFLLYFAPFTSPKPKHLKMKNTIDFLKIDNGNLGVINFNNMIPIPMEHRVINRELLQRIIDRCCDFKVLE